MLVTPQNDSQGILWRKCLREIVVLAPKLAPLNLFCELAFGMGGQRHDQSVA